MIEKPTILITSIGRTGTEFFAKLFAELVPDCTSLHEPDIIKYHGVENKVENYRQQTLRAGVRRIVVLKAMGRWTIVKLSDARLAGKLDYHKAIKHLYAQRNDFIAKCSGSIYIESNLGYYGLIDVTSDVFNRHRVIYLIRDGRDWIRSMLNWGEVYGKRGIRKYIAHNWPTAKAFPDDPFADKWDGLSRFEKLCWAWTKLNGFALDSISKNPDARVFRFENIFLADQKYQHLDDLISFATSHLGIPQGSFVSTTGWLEKKIHKSSDGFPGWDRWSIGQKRQFEKICGPLMEKIGYSI